MMSPHEIGGSELTKRSVAPLSSRAFVERIWPVSMVFIDIGSSKEFALGFEAMISVWGSNLIAHAGT
jgi:hypothetical protein